MKHNIDSILFRCTISGPSALIICPILCIGMLIAIVICSYYLAVIPLYTDVAALFLEGGYLIQVLSDTPYTDTLNGPLYQAETDRIYAPNVSSCRYYQLFWIEGSMPTNYEIYSTGSDYSISYSALMREAKQLQEKLANKK